MTLTQHCCPPTADQWVDSVDHREYLGLLLALQSELTTALRAGYFHSSDGSDGDSASRRRDRRPKRDGGGAGVEANDDEAGVERVRDRHGASDGNGAADHAGAEGDTTQSGVAHSDGRSGALDRTGTHNRDATAASGAHSASSARSSLLGGAEVGAPGESSNHRDCVHQTPASCLRCPACQARCAGRAGKALVSRHPVWIGAWRNPPLAGRFAYMSYVADACSIVGQPHLMCRLIVC